MADYVTGVKTNQGEKKIDYNYLANKLKTKDGSEDGYLISAKDKEKLDNTASNDKLINLQNEITGTINTMQTDIANALDTKVDKNTFNSTVSNLSSNIDSKAPTNHLSPTTTYGVANKDNYGHVKLSDNYSGQTVEVEGVAASTYAVNALAQRVPTFGAYVVEEGELEGSDNTVWRYRKWNTGIKECWCRYSRSGVNLATSTGVNGIVYSSHSLRANFPTNFFTEQIYTCIASFDGIYYGSEKNVQRTYYSAFPFFKDGATTTQTQEIALYRIGDAIVNELDKAYDLTAVVNFYAVGK